MPRQIPVISAEKVLELEPSDVSLSWACSKPADGLKDCEVRLAKKAAAAAGFDLVTITGNIHPTTKQGTRRDKPHFNVKFQSTRYLRQTEQSVHINVHVWSTHFQQWTQYQMQRRPANYPYDQVYQDGNIRFYRALPKTLAQEEIAAERQRQQEKEQRRLEEEQRAQLPKVGKGSSSGSAAKDAGGGGESSTAGYVDGWYPDPWTAKSGKAERWYASGKWSDSTR